MKLKTFKTFQYNITWTLHINSSHRMFSSIHDLTFLMTQKFKDKPLLSLQKKINFWLRDCWWNLLCCLHDQSCWQFDLPACLPARVRSRGSHWQAWRGWSSSITDSYLWKADNRNRQTRCELCPKLTPEEHQLISFWYLHC